MTDAMRSAGVTRGPAYFFPYSSFKEMKSAPVIEKFKRGPVGLLTVLPSGPPAMGKNLVHWFLYCVVIGIFAAYLSSRTLATGTAFLQVFRVVGTTAFLGYGAAHAQESIWSGRSWVVTLKHLFDSVIYAVADYGSQARMERSGIATWPVQPRGQRSRSAGADFDTTLRREAASLFAGLGKPVTRFR